MSSGTLIDLQKIQEISPIGDNSCLDGQEFVWSMTAAPLSLILVYSGLLRLGNIIEPLLNVLGNSDCTGLWLSLHGSRVCPIGEQLRHLRGEKRSIEACYGNLPATSMSPCSVLLVLLMMTFKL